MTSLPVASLAARGRGAISTSTVLHVLNLVHARYAAPPAPACPVHSLRSYRTESAVRQRRSDLRSSQRTFASAHALRPEVDEPSDDPHEDLPWSEDFPDLDPPPDDIPPPAPPPPRRPIPSAHLPASIIDFVWGPDVPARPIKGDPIAKEALRKFRIGMGDGHLQESGLLKRLRQKNGFREAKEFVELDPTPADLADYRTIELAFVLFQRSADFEAWNWLARKLVAMLRSLQSMDGGIFDHNIPLLAHSLLGHALLQSLDDLNGGEVRDRQTLAGFQVDKTRRLRAAMPSTHARLSFEYSLGALVLAQIGDLTEARLSITKAIDHHLRVRNFRYPEPDMLSLERYAALVMAFGRPEDMALVAARHQRILSPMLQRDTFNHPIYPRFTGLFKSSLAQVPLEWWEAQRRNSPKDKGIEQCGVMMFVARCRSPSIATQGFRAFDRLQALHVRMPSAHVVELCRMLVADRQKDQAMQVYRAFMQHPPNLSHTALSRLQKVLVACDQLGEAAAIQQRMFAQCAPAALTTQDVLSVASAYAKRGDVPGTIAAMRNIPEAVAANRISPLHVLHTAFFHAGDTAGATKVLHRIAAKSSPSSKIAAYTRQIRFHAKNNEVALAVQVFDELLASGLSPTVGVYTALVTVFSKQRDQPNVNRVVKAMSEQGVDPDETLCAAVINADVHCGDWTSAATRWAALPAHLQAAPKVTTAIMKAFVFLSAPTKLVRRLFDQIPRPQSRQYSMLMLSLIDKFKLDEAVALVEEMDRKARLSPASPQPTIFTFSILMYGYLSTRREEQARLVYDEIVRRGLIPNFVTYGMIVQNFLYTEDKSAALERAHEFAMSVFRKAQDDESPIGKRKLRQTGSIFDPLIGIAGKLGRTETAQAYLDLATSVVEPDVRILTQMMDAHRRNSDLEQVLTLWERIFDKAKGMVQPPDFMARDPLTNAEFVGSQSRSNLLCIPLSIVLGALSTESRYDDVKRIWREVNEAGFAYDAANYQHLATALARCGDLEGAFHIVDRVLIARWEQVRNRRHRIIRQHAKLAQLKRKPDLPPFEAISIDAQSHWQELHEEIEQSEESEDPLDESLPVASNMLETADEPASNPNLGAKRRSEMIRREYPPLPSESEDGQGPPLGMGDMVVELLTSWRPQDLEWKPSVLTRTILSHAYGQVQIHKRQLRNAINEIGLPLEASVAAAASADNIGLDGRAHSSSVAGKPTRILPLDTDEPKDDAIHPPADPIRPPPMADAEAVPESIVEDSDSAPPLPEMTDEERRERIQDLKRPHIVTLPGFNDVPVLHRGKPANTTPSHILGRLTLRYPKVIDYIMFHRRKRDLIRVERRDRLTAYTRRIEKGRAKQVQSKIEYRNRKRGYPKHEPGLERRIERKAKALDQWLEARDVQLRVREHHKISRLVTRSDGTTTRREHRPPPEPLNFVKRDSPPHQGRAEAEKVEMLAQGVPAEMVDRKEGVEGAEGTERDERTE